MLSFPVISSGLLALSHLWKYLQAFTSFWLFVICLLYKVPKQSFSGNVKMVTVKIVIVFCVFFSHPPCIFQTLDYVFSFWDVSWIVCSRNSKMERITNLSLTKLTYFYPKRGIFCNLRYSKLMATLYSYLLWSSQDFFSYRLQLFETFI